MKISAFMIHKTNSYYLKDSVENCAKHCTFPLVLLGDDTNLCVTKDLCKHIDWYQNKHLVK